MKNMKFLFLGLVFLAIGRTTYGQANRIDMGLEGGPSGIFLRGNEIVKNIQKPGVGFSGGLFLQYNFSKIISLRTNFAIERKGSVMTGLAYDQNGILIGEYSGYTRFDYLTIPLLIRATFGKKVQFFINAGPYLGYLLKETYVTKSEHFPTQTQEGTLHQTQTDKGISAGFGLSIPIQTAFAFSFELRNNLGLTNVSAVPVFENGTLKTNSTNLLLGFAFKLGQRASGAG